jgi:hypothetical protein
MAKDQIVPGFRKCYSSWSESSKGMKNIPKSWGYLTPSNGIFPIQASEGQGFLAILHIMAGAIAILVYRLVVAADT